MVIIMQVAVVVEVNLDQLEVLEVLVEGEQVEHLFQEDQQILAVVVEET
jgi:hypothetical protein